MSKKILTLDNVPVINKKIGKIDTIEKLKASTIYSLGDVVEVLGFHAKGDGSHHKRVAKSADDGSGEEGQNGIWWCLIDKTIAKNWGCVGNKDNFVKFINYWNTHSTGEYLDITELGVIETNETIHIHTYNYKEKTYDFTGTLIKYTGADMGVKIGRAINHGMMANRIINLEVECNGADIGILAVETAYATYEGFNVLGTYKTAIIFRGVILATIKGCRKIIGRNAMSESIIKFETSSINEDTGLPHPLRYTNNGTTISEYLFVGKHSDVAVVFGYGGGMTMKDCDFESIDITTPLSLRCVEMYEINAELQGFDFSKSSGGGNIENCWFENFGSRAIEIDGKSRCNFKQISTFGSGEKIILVKDTAKVNVENSNLQVVFDSSYKRNNILQNNIEITTDLLNSTTNASVGNSKAIIENVSHLLEADNSLDLTKCYNSLLGNSRTAGTFSFRMVVTYRIGSSYNSVFLDCFTNGIWLNTADGQNKIVYNYLVSSCSDDKATVIDKKLILGGTPDLLYCEIITTTFSA